MHLQDLTPDIARFLGLPEGTKGAIITEVVPGSRARPRPACGPRT